MVYILDQRLKAQAIPMDKSCRVLSDVLHTMFDRTFVDKMFAPQDLYSLTNTRKIFERLVHSSIMRLSEQRCASCWCCTSRKRKATRQLGAKTWGRSLRAYTSIYIYTLRTCCLWTGH